MSPKTGLETGSKTASVYSSKNHVWGLVQVKQSGPVYESKSRSINRFKNSSRVVKQLAQIKRIGINAKMVDPLNPGETVKVPIDKREKIREFKIQWQNYVDPLRKYDFLLYFKNSTFITVVATIITLIINSMAAYALSIYEFRGKNFALVFVIGTLLIPLTIILVPVFYVVANFGMINSLWGVILPGAATPTGVFLLRQYMLTLPRELIEAARMDHASEWAIYWRVVLPLSIPAIAVLAIFP